MCCPCPGAAIFKKMQKDEDKEGSVGMADLIIGGILLIIVGAAIIYIVKAKKSGIKCIGCPAAGQCSGADAGHFGGGCSGHCDTKGEVEQCSGNCAHCAGHCSQ